MVATASDRREDACPPPMTLATAHQTGPAHQTGSAPGDWPRPSDLRPGDLRPGDLRPPPSVFFFPTPPHRILAPLGIYDPSSP